VVAYLAFPIVPGATSNDVYAHGFNDTASWGQEIRRTLLPPFPVFSGCSLATGWGVNGETGTVPDAAERRGRAKQLDSIGDLQLHQSVYRHGGGGTVVY
jgi:hypothetical protein